MSLICKKKKKADCCTFKCAVMDFNWNSVRFECSPESVVELYKSYGSLMDVMMFCEHHLVGLCG